MGYETVDEAIELANDTRYGLGASVFGPDQKLCIEVAQELDCGMVAVNDFAVFYVRFVVHLFTIFLNIDLIGEVSSIA